MITIPELIAGYEKHLYILFGEKANTLIKIIGNNLKNRVVRKLQFQNNFR